MIPHTAYQVCAVIPVYQHADVVDSVITRLLTIGLHCYIINDGGNHDATEQLRTRYQHHANVTLIEQFPNQGKGKAVFAGFKQALNDGYSHALQIDADGQHHVEDAHQLINQSKNNTSAVVTAIPIYDSSVPKSRLYSRYITHFWVWVETLSFDIKDSMCGFRIYPLALTVPLLEKNIASRMDFDTQILVRLYWAGCRVISIPSKVHYPENGISNFRLLRDNIRITCMHTKLVIGMLLRLPKLLWRKVK